MQKISIFLLLGGIVISQVITNVSPLKYSSNVRGKEEDTPDSPY
jgi:hypothetical protein